MSRTSTPRFESSSRRASEVGHAFTITSGEDETGNDFGNFEAQVLEGCTPGFGKNHSEAWSSTGLDPDQTLEDVFDVPDEFGLDDVSLIEALDLGGGKGKQGAAQILLRAAVAAILNASHPDVNHGFALADIIANVNAALTGNRPGMIALAAELDAANNAGCPLGNGTVAVVASAVPLGLPPLILTAGILGTIRRRPVS